MIKISMPEIKKSNLGYRIQVHFGDSRKDILWYEVEEAYKKYLTIERADGFLVALLFYALKNEEDIEVQAPISENLYYSITKYLIPLLVKIHGFKRIKIYCDTLISSPIENAGGVGTGLSCGIDSFATIVDHMDSDTPMSYRISHFTFFNVGSHGDFGGEKARRFFKERAEVVKQYADECNKEFITVDSNISEILQMNFRQTNTLRSLSAILVLQKLFKSYYYSSGYPITRFSLSNETTNSFDIFNMSMLSTETTRFYSSCPIMNRVEKTKLVSKYSPTYRHLNVCFFNKENCGKCPKCLRTLLTLEVIGMIDNYKDAFDLNAYYTFRSRFIAKVFLGRKNNASYKEIYNEMLVRNFEIPLHSKILYLVYLIKTHFKRRFMGRGRYTKLKNTWKLIYSK